MNITIHRHRATRRCVFSILYIDDFECFTIERRSDMLEPGAHWLKVDGDNVMIGDHPVSGDARKEGRAGFLIVGLVANNLSLSETGNAMELLKKQLARADGEDIHVEVFDEVNYLAVE